MKAVQRLIWQIYCPSNGHVDAATTAIAAAATTTTTTKLFALNLSSLHPGSLPHSLLHPGGSLFVNS